MPQQVVQQIIADGGIKLRNKENNATIFKKQMDQIGQGVEAADEDDQLQEDIEPEEAVMVSTNKLRRLLTLSFHSFRR